MVDVGGFASGTSDVFLRLAGGGFLSFLFLLLELFEGGLGERLAIRSIGR
jgi:hypothetical protein